MNPGDLAKDDFVLGSSEAEITLNDIQINLLMEEWNNRKDNPPSITELCEIVFGKPNLDGRSKEGRAIKKKLSEVNIKIQLKTKYKPKGLIELTREQRDFVDNNHKIANPTNSNALTSLECAKILFNKSKLTNLDTETRSIVNYVRFAFPDSFIDTEDIPDGDYTSPKTLEGIVQRINKYKFHTLDKATLTGKQKKDSHALLGYMNTYRFKMQINTYSNQSDRDLFESTFLRYTFDKFDLTEEEVDQYLLLSTEVVIAASIQRRLELLNEKLDEASKEDDKSISMSWVEAIGKTQSEYNACITRQQRLLDSLKMKRSDKEGKNKDGQASILNLVELAKQEESRIKLIKLAQKRQESVKETIKEFMTMDELKSRIIGITENEVLNG